MSACIYCGNPSDGPICYACMLGQAQGRKGTGGDRVQVPLGQYPATPQPTVRKGPWASEPTPRPMLHLTRLSGRYPKFWRSYEDMRRDRVRLGDWPAWCYCPVAGAYAIVSGGKDTPLSPAQQCEIPELAAVAAWRPTKGIYRFDPDLWRALIDTPIAGELPVDVLQRLPEWCVYLEAVDAIPGASKLTDGRPVFGFFAHLEHDANDGRAELRILIDAGEGLVPIILHLVPGGIQAALTAAFAESVRNAPGWFGSTLQLKAIQEYSGAVAAACISLLLYLCSDEPDYATERRPRIPREERGKRGDRIKAAQAPIVWDVGVRIGSVIRKSRETQPAEPQGGSHASPRPHLRRAHWHLYWTGQGRTVPRVKWLSPLLVGGDGVVPTIHPVKA